MSGYFLALLGPFALWLMTWVIRNAYRRAKGRASPAPKSVDVARCRCGYDVSHLEILRCPECGRVIGFDATAEEMGLTEVELRTAATRRRARAKNGEISDE